jgi:hypothetical protein
LAESSGLNRNPLPEDRFSAVMKAQALLFKIAESGPDTRKRCGGGDIVPAADIMPKGALI